MSVQRQVWPFQCTPAPPTPSPGRNDPNLRIGSASCEGLLRIVSVSFWVFIMRSWRNWERSSSRTDGRPKSASVLRGPPRSSATTFRPAALNSLASMPPVQPRPTMTTSTSFSLAATSFSSAHVRDAHGVDRVFLVAILFDVLVVHRDHPGEADHLPAGLVSVAAVNRVREHALHDVLVHRREENARGRPVFERHLAGPQTLEKFLALALADLVEALAVSLHAERIGRGDAGAVQLGGGERELVALARHAPLPPALHVEAGRPSPPPPPGRRGGGGVG